jgi:hypothetical protein
MAASSSSSSPERNLARYNHDRPANPRKNCLPPPCRQGRVWAHAAWSTAGPISRILRRRLWRRRSSSSPKRTWFALTHHSQLHRCHQSSSSTNCGLTSHNSRRGSGVQGRRFGVGPARSGYYTLSLVGSYLETRVRRAALGVWRWAAVAWRHAGARRLRAGPSKGWPAGRGRR